MQTTPAKPTPGYRIPKYDEPKLWRFPEVGEEGGRGGNVYYFPRIATLDDNGKIQELRHGGPLLCPICDIDNDKETGKATLNNLIGHLVSRDHCHQLNLINTMSIMGNKHARDLRRFYFQWEMFNELGGAIEERLSQLPRARSINFNIDKMKKRFKCFKARQLPELVEKKEPEPEPANKRRTETMDSSEKGHGRPRSGPKLGHFSGPGIISASKLGSKVTEAFKQSKESSNSNSDKKQKTPSSEKQQTLPSSDKERKAPSSYKERKAPSSDRDSSTADQVTRAKKRRLVSADDVGTGEGQSPKRQKTGDSHSERNSNSNSGTHKTHESKVR
ncbi:hypothetical protein ABW19_dt0202757 [Dactylella cylindrospora]|nr:hypothetical protein ABW19_dt0202757 [Dactylella cylindrospora]